MSCKGCFSIKRHLFTVKNSYSCNCRLTLRNIFCIPVQHIWNFMFIILFRNKEVHREKDRLSSRMSWSECLWIAMWYSWGMVTGKCSCITGHKHFRDIFQQKHGNHSFFSPKREFHNVLLISNNAGLKLRLLI